MRYETTEMTPFGRMLQPASASSADLRELPIERLHELARQHQLLVLRGFDSFADADSFADYCSLWGEVAIWPFGRVLELVEQEHPTDHIFHNNYMPLHWDGMYRKQVPEFQFFHCVSAPEVGQGGRTTFSNTLTALRRADPQLSEWWGGVTGIYQRKMEYYDSTAMAPIITAHPVHGGSVIRYNEPSIGDGENFINPPILQFTGIAEADLDDFHRSLRRVLYAPECFYAHSWRTGDVVIADNYTLLHGREAFTRGAARHLRRVHVLGKPPLDNPHLVAYQ